MAEHVTPQKETPMTPTNRPISSREYKLMLNTERFRDRRAGASLFWKLLGFLVENQGNEVVPDFADPEKDVEKTRTTWYLDTPGYELQRANITLRLRDEPAVSTLPARRTMIAWSDSRPRSSPEPTACSATCRTRPAGWPNSGRPRRLTCLRFSKRN